MRTATAQTATPAPDSAPGPASDAPPNLPSPSNAPNAAPGTGPADDPLMNLRDIHLPEPVGWWPPAPGWWVVLGLIAAAFAFFLIARRRRADAPRRAALNELAVARSEFERSGDGHAAVSDVSTILRRYALEQFPGRDVASLIGDKWLDFLDNSALGDASFKHQVGDLLTKAPYQNALAIDPLPLFEASAVWITNVQNRTPDSVDNRLSANLRNLSDDAG